MKTEVIVLGLVVVIGVVILSFFRPVPARGEDRESTATIFVFVQVPESIQPVERAAKYEDQLDASLKREKLGEVTGGGSQLSEPDAEGKRTIDWVGIDVELTDLERGLPFLKKELQRLGAPRKTTLEYTRAGSQVTESVVD